MEESIIYFRDVSLDGFKGKNRLDGISLELPVGHVYGVFGLDESSTALLLQGMAGVVCPSRGELLVGGFSPGRRQRAFLEDVFYVPEFPVMPGVSVATLVSTYGKLYPKFNKDVFDECINAFGIDYATFLGRKSLRENKRALLAFAIASGAGLLLLEQPVSLLDRTAKQEFLSLLMSNYSSESTTIFMSCNDPGEIEKVIDHAIFFDKKGLLFDSSLAELSSMFSFGTMSTGASGIYVDGLNVLSLNTSGLCDDVNLGLLLSALNSSRETCWTIVNRVNKFHNDKTA